MVSGEQGMGRFEARGCYEARHQHEGKGEPVANYSLLIVDERRTLEVAAANCGEALEAFGKELGQSLSLEDSDGAVYRHLLDEWQIGPHWVNHTISVYGTTT
jgi:hypothetical protein